jgi:signal transduction histidine kinase
MRFAERIFQMFQRLHERGKYPGSGIGLAISKRIVERHGGTIWVESEQGVGTTFKFTLTATRASNAS